MAVFLPNKLSLNKDLSCLDCNVSKDHRLPFKLSNTSINCPFALIYSDVWGPFTVANAPFHFYVLFVDDYSRFTWVYPLNYKSELYNKLLVFKAYIDTQFQTSLKLLRTDCGTEFVNKRVDTLLSSHGIVHQSSYPYTQAQNGIAECKHKHIIETAITLLHHSSVPINFWFDAIATATFLINRMSSSVLHHKTPFEMSFHTLPNFSFFKVFDC